MKKFIYSALLFCSITAANAQERINELWFSYGISVPVGEFASTDLNNPDAGYAKTGYNYRLNYQWNVSTYFGFVAILQATFNRIDPTEVANTYNPIADWEKRNWSIVGTQIGAVGKLPLNDRIRLEARATFGFNSATFGGIKLKSASTTVEMDKAKSIAFVYSAGVGVKIKATDRLFIPVHIDYLGCKTSFSDVETTRSDPNGSTTTTSSFDAPMNNINSSLGVGFIF